jgi:hypothetical protein
MPILLNTQQENPLSQRVGPVVYVQWWCDATLCVVYISVVPASHTAREYAARGLQYKEQSF